MQEIACNVSPIFESLRTDTDRPRVDGQARVLDSTPRDKKRLPETISGSMTQTLKIARPALQFASNLSSRRLPRIALDFSDNGE